MAELRLLLKHGRIQLLTLTGPPGVGKTRLAIAVAAGIAAQFADGVAYVALSHVANSRLVVPTIARVLGAPEAMGRSLQQGLISFLRPRHLLLLLDNFEQIVDAATEISELLSIAPGLQVLVTSRERLRLRGEHVVVVPTLSLPAAPVPSVTDEELVASVHQSAAAQLFVARSRDAHATFAVTPANARAISTICHQLDGLPLAIELAAAHSRVLAPQALLARLSFGLNSLQLGSRDLPARQKSMKATIAWSYDRLGHEEQRIFRRLAVFIGGCTVEAAVFASAREGDTGNPGHDVGQTFALLEGLADRSLLYLIEEPAGPGGEVGPRFGMLETIRAFARERLAQATEEEAAQQRQCAWCVALAARAEREVQGTEQASWMDRLEREQDNLRAALTWSLEHDASAALRLGKGLWRFWRQRGYLSEGRHWLEAILERTGIDRSVDRATRGWVLVGAGIIRTLQGDLQGARPLLAASVQDFREVGDPVGLAQALRDLGYLLLINGDDPPVARGMFEEALRLGQAQQDTRGIGAACYLLGLLSEHELDYPRARALTENGLSLFRRLGDLWSICASLWQLGRIALAEADLRRAAVLLRDLLNLAQAHHDRQNIALATLGLAVLSLREGDRVQTQRLLQACVPQFHAIHDPAIFCAVGLLGGLAIRSGELPQGVRLLAAGTGDPQWQHRVQTRIDPLSFLRAEDEQSLSQARATLGDDAFERAWAEGQAMTLEQVVSSALTMPIL